MTQRNHTILADDIAKKKPQHKKSAPTQTLDGNAGLPMAKSAMVMHLQRTIGNRATQRVLAHKKPPVIQQQPENGRVQRTLDFNNLLTQKDKKYADLAGVLYATLNNHPLLKRLDANKHMAIEVKVDNSKDPNPADIRWSFGPVRQFIRGTHVGKFIVKAKGLLQVRKWFVDAYDLGTAASTINHELGVHLLPYYPEIEKLSGIRAGITEKKLTKVHELSQNERDHRAAVDPKNPNSKIYWGLVRTTANSLVDTKKTKDAKSAVFAYLMDCAAMDDAGNKIALPFLRTKAGLGHIAKRYAEFWQDISKDKQLKKAALPASTMSKWQISKQYLKLYWRVLKMLTSST